MIISASRRTDLPAFYAEWLMRRLQEGSVLVPHPRNPGRLGSARLSPDHVDCLVFWTKNPAPMLNKLKILDDLGYRYYFSFTVTAYGSDLEPGLPPKAEVIETFQRLAERLGPGRVDWRFDPVMITEEFSIQRHLDIFGDLCGRLAGFTERCLMNFVKGYRHLGSRVREPEAAEVRKAAAGLAAVAAEHGLPLFHCAGSGDLKGAGLRSGACIDRAKIEEIVGGPLQVVKDPGQPKACRCMTSFDLGMYDTCAHGCVYCYATVSPKTVQRRRAAHVPDSPLLVGRPRGTESVTDRTRPSHRSLFL